jgi:hypothetical protein
LSARQSTTTYYDTAPKAYGYREENTLVLTYDQELDRITSEGKHVYELPNHIDGEGS